MDNIDTPITEGYQKAGNLDVIRQELRKTGVVQLQKFLNTYYYGRIYNILRVAQTKELLVPAKYKIKTIIITGQIDDLLVPVRKYVELITDAKVRHTKIIKAEHEDYTLITDEQKSERGYDAILDFTNGWNPKFGGLIYYKFFDQNIKISVPSMQNSLVIVNKNDSKSYMKYINHQSKGKERIFIVFST